MEGHDDAEAGSAGRGAGEPGQTGEGGVGHAQTGSGRGFLQHPVPPDVEGGGDPHQQAAEEADTVRGQLFAAFLGRLPDARTSSVRVTRRGAGPPRPAQRLQGDQRAAQEHRSAVHIAEEEQEAEGDEVASRGQLSGSPGLGDAEKGEKSCGRHEFQLEI